MQVRRIPLIVTSRLRANRFMRGRHTGVDNDLGSSDLEVLLSVSGKIAMSPRA